MNNYVHGVASYPRSTESSSFQEGLAPASCLPGAYQVTVCRGVKGTPCTCPHPHSGCHVHPTLALAGEGLQRMEGPGAGCAPTQQIWGGRVPESPGRQERPGQPAAILPQRVASLCVQESTEG